MVGVEIDGEIHIAQPEHIRKDRILQSEGINVIHLLNSELTRHGSKMIRLLPPEIRQFYKAVTAEKLTQTLNKMSPITIRPLS